MHRSAKLLLAGVLGCIASLSPPAIARNTPLGHCSWYEYGSAEGLGSTALLALLQDRQGFMWLGTEDGLYRYDGVHFDRYGLKDGLPSAVVERLYQDTAGTIWAGSNAGLASLTGSKSIAVATHRGMPASPINSITDGPGGVWIATSEGIFVGSAANGFQRLSGWPGGAATALFYKDSTMWAARWAHGRSTVLSFRPGGWQTVSKKDLGDEPIDSIARDTSGRMWFRSKRSLWLYSKDGFSKLATPAPLVAARGDLQTSRTGRDVFVLSDQVVQYLKDGHWSPLPCALEGGARAIVEDREGTLWFGAGGTRRILGRGLFRTYDAREGLPSVPIFSIVRDKKQQLWIGTPQGLYGAYAGGFRRVAGTEGFFVRSIVSSNDGSLLYLGGQPSNVILKYDVKHSTLTRIPIDVEAKRIFRLLIDSDDTLWVATDGAGLLKASRADQKELRFAKVSLPVREDYVGDVRVDSSGHLWITGEHGLAISDKGLWRQFPTVDGLRQKRLSLLRPLKNGDMLGAYFEPYGIEQLRYVDGKIKAVAHFDQPSTSTADKAFLMGEDAAGHIWIGGGQGLDMVTAHGVHHFDRRDGLPAEDMVNSALLADPNGDVWFGTVNGLVRFDNSRFLALPTVQSPRVTLLELRLGNQQFEPGAPNVQVPHSNNVFTARYVALSLFQSYRLQYRVQLKGLEDVPAITDVPRARYPGLRGGRYRFIVSARIGERGAWGPETSVSFEIAPAWWQRPWFVALLVLFALAAILVAVRWRMHSLKRRNRQLKVQVANRTRDLMVANEALREQSLTDSLTDLRNRRYVEVSIKEEVSRLLRVHQNNVYALSASSDADLMFVLVDLDHFKNVNDTYGHAAGDKVIRQAADELRAVVRESDTVVRWGGEEFLVIARDCSRRDSAILAERIRAAIAATKFDLGGGRVARLTCSIGFAGFPFASRTLESVSWERVISLADQCMYAAKMNGRNAWVGIDTAPGVGAESLREPLEIEGLLAWGVLLLQTSLHPDAELRWPQSPSLMDEDQMSIHRIL